MIIYPKKSLVSSKVHGRIVLTSSLNSVGAIVSKSRRAPKKSTSNACLGRNRCNQDPTCCNETQQIYYCYRLMSEALKKMCADHAVNNICFADGEHVYQLPTLIFSCSICTFFVPVFHCTRCTPFKAYSYLRRSSSLDALLDLGPAI